MNIKFVMVTCLSMCLLLGLIIIPNSIDNTHLNACDYFRVHIRANSNSQEDQNIKYKIKDEVVSAMIPLLTNATTKAQAIDIVSNNLDMVCDICDKVLRDNGFKYQSTAKIKKEEFPTRKYDNLTLASGVYDSLIIYLGNGIGNNWWCVVYPPLCFVGADAIDEKDIKYKSKLIEIINNFFGGK